MRNPAPARKSVKFRPTLDGTLEDRALQSSFAAQLGPVATMGYRGNWVLTSRTYEQVQRSVDSAIKAFSNQAVRLVQTAYQRGLAYGDVLGKLGAQGIAEAGGYRSTMLGRLDQLMYRNEQRLPYGLGRAGNTGGVGLSSWTSFTSRSNPVGHSVAQQLDLVLTDLSFGEADPTPQQVRNAIEGVRIDTLAVMGSRTSTGLPGILPSYVIAFGPGGEGAFGLKNS